MAERIDEWPRVQSCLYNWCPNRRDDCEKCDRVLEIMRRHREAKADSSTSSTAGTTK